MSHIQGHFITEETRPLPSYLVSYFKMFDALNKDRQSTLDILSQAPRDDKKSKVTTTFEEMNPLLGKHPSKNKVNAFFAADLAFPYIMKSLPDWAKSSLADTIAFNETMLADQNNRAIKTGNSPNNFPVGAKFTYHGDWDSALQNLFKLLTKRDNKEKK